jgi:DnaK suppressor protein
MRRIGKREIQGLRERLQAAERALLQHVTAHRCSCRAVAEAVESDEDRGQVAPLEAGLDRLEEHEREELAEILAALARIEQGTYGACEACGEPIPLARLRVVPATPHCVDCHAAAEHEGTAR